MKKLKLLLVVGIVLLLSGCLSREEKKEVNDITDKAKKYMKQKYNKYFNVEKSGKVVSSNTTFVTYADEIYIEFTDGTTALYFPEEQEFYDNYQSKKIAKELTDKIYVPMMKEISTYKFIDNYNIEPSFNLYDEQGLRGNFFHEYYDNDIDKFIKNEKLSLNIGYYDNDENWHDVNMYIISKDNNEWKTKFEIVDNYINKYLKNQKDYDLNLIAVTPELYEKEIKGKDIVSINGANINIGKEGCFASGNMKKLYLQKYVKVSKGIYATVYESNFELQDGDITFKEVMKADELQKIIDNISKEKDVTNNYLIKSISPIYELEFSDRIKNTFKSNMTVYFKIDTKELGISDENNLYTYPILRYGKSDSYENYVIVSGTEKSGKSDYINISKNQNKDYYWIGRKVDKN